MRGPAAWNLHTRVGVMVTLVVLAVAVLLGAGSAAVVYPVMTGQRRETAQRQADINAGVAGEVLRTTPTSLGETLRTLDRPMSSYSLVATDGRWYASQAAADAADLPEDLRTAAATGRSVTRRVQLADGPSLVAVRPLADGTSGYVEVFPLADTVQAMRILLLVLVGAGSITVVLGMLLGRWAASAALRPVAALTRAAGAVAGGDLGVRLPVGSGADMRTITDAFNHTVAALQRRVEQDARFAANVSHELRTPLTTIVNAVALLDARRGALAPTDREVVGLLSDDVDRLQRSVTDLLELSTAVETPLVAEQVPVAELAAVADRVAGHQVSDVPRDAGVVLGDRRRLERVIANLADNAERHGGGLVRVGMERGTAGVRLVVDDAGPGVPPDQRQAVFERFSRLQPHRTGGAGLGLALVAEEVSRHAGRVWVQDGPAGGARFVVELPSRPPTRVP